MEALLEKIQKMNLSAKEVISGECLSIKLTFLDDVIDSFYNMEKWRFDFIITKNKIRLIFPDFFKRYF